MGKLLVSAAVCTPWTKLGSLGVTTAAAEIQHRARENLNGKRKGAVMVGKFSRQTPLIVNPRFPDAIKPNHSNPQVMPAVVFSCIHSHGWCARGEQTGTGTTL